jgi:NAD-dependent SIR2 family protein deacetylase
MDEQAAAACAEAARLIAAAPVLLITAGAGMGVDSGMPDFRGEQGFWQAYPGLRLLGMRFHEIASPQAFERMPRTAWGFYGHRLNLYRKARPHRGFAHLLELARQRPGASFVFTSNVDGQFQAAGFQADTVAECHGSIHHLQCMRGCGQPVWPADGLEPDVDSDTCTLRSDLPSCPRCGALARPNILMFGDAGFEPDRVDAQLGRLRHWLAAHPRPLVIELGAGTAIPTVRRLGEQLEGPLVRINPREPDTTRQGQLGIAAGAAVALDEIMRCLAHG